MDRLAGARYIDRRVTYRTRFAPSPTGPLHLGHAFSAILAHDMARAEGGECHLRIEDTDIDRCRPEWETLIFDDLAWLGLRFEPNVRRQSEHLELYNTRLSQLADRGLLYPCSCSRRDIRAVLSAPQEGVEAPDVYPGTCRNRPISDRKSGDALRLNMAAALNQLGPLGFTETGAKHAGQHRIDPGRMIAEIGDAVLGRKEIETVSYVLATVVDDAHQDMTHIVRGEDLFQITFLQVVLQRLLDLPTPVYHHHRLIRDEAGKRLAKRDDARAIRTYRQNGATPQDIRTLVGLS